MTYFMITVLLVLAAAVSCSFGAPVKRQTTTPITYAQFVNLPLGSSPTQVSQNFNGNTGIVESEVSVPGVLDIKIIQYSNTNPVYNVQLTFTNNLLTMKAQSGLNTNQYPITRNTYNQVAMGMTRAAVTALLGSAGQLTGAGSGGIEVYSYNAPGAAFALVTFTFTQGSLTGRFEYGL
jgi:hypothetical protein